MYTADPVHKLFAAKGGGLWMNAFLDVALSVPVKQQRVLRCFKGWLCVTISNRTNSVASRTAIVMSHTLRNISLPLKAACGALPLSPEVTASKRLLRYFGILVLIPILELARRLSSKRVVLAHLSAFTIWAFGALCAVMHSGFPDMRASCWTVGA